MPTSTGCPERPNCRSLASTIFRKAPSIAGFDGEISLRVENLPPGFSAPATLIGPEENSTAFALWADAGAADPGKAQPFKVVAQAMIGGKEVMKEVTGGLPKLVAPGDIVRRFRINIYPQEPLPLVS